MSTETLSDGYMQVELWEGTIFDPESGEYLAAEGDGDLTFDTELGWLWKPSGKPAFVVDTLDKADWVLEKVATAEAQLKALAARKAAVIENLERQEREWQRRRDGLLFRFREQLRAVAEAELSKRGKGKTLALTHGTLAFRKSQGATRLADIDKALAWAKANAPTKVQRKEWITPTDARKAVEALIVDGELNDYPEWIEVSGPAESFSIKTGINPREMAGQA